MKKEKKSLLTKEQVIRRDVFKDEAEKILSSCTIKKLKSIKKKLDGSEYKEWNQDYHSLISHGKKIDFLDKDEFRVFVMAVYAWMPVLYSQTNIKGLKKNIIKLLASKELNNGLIEESKEFFTSKKHSSGSISALSKTLHFCKPTKFPVWDTRVAKALGRKTGTGNNTKIYVDYFSVMTELKNDKSLSVFYTNYKNIIDKKASKLRAIEHVLFLYE